MDEDTKQFIIKVNTDLTKQINNVFVEIKKDIAKLQDQTSQLIEIGKKNQNTIDELIKKLRLIPVY